jgi:Bacterial pre-peptidase C-terminal domain
MKKFRTQWLWIVLLTFFITACGNQSNPPVPPFFTIVSGDLVLVSNDAVSIKGEFGGGVKITELSYRLNDGNPQDVLPSLQGKAFEFTVSSLKTGTNIILIAAKDKAGGNVSKEVRVTFEPSLNVSGLWGDQTINYQACGASYFAVAALSLEQSQGNSLSGSLILNFSGLGKTYSGEFTGSVDYYGIVSGALSLRFGDEVYTTYLMLQREQDLLRGELKLQLPCFSVNEEVYLDLELQKGVGLPVPPQDDAREPNDKLEQASPITLNYNNDLIFVNDSDDWFTFTVTANTFVSLNIKAYQQANYALEARLFRDTSSITFLPVLFDGTASASGGWPLQPGTYRLQITGRVLNLPAISYALELTTKTEADNAFEPNDTSDQATPIELPFDFNLDFSEWRDDEDWFTFELKEESLLKIEPTTYQVSLYNSKLENVYNAYYSDAKELLLLPGKYYLKTSFSTGKNYRLALSVEGIPDATYEINNSKDKATFIQDGFRGSMFIFPTDEDWFTFTLSENRIVTIDLGTSSYQLDYQLFKSTVQPSTYNQNYNGEAIQKGLVAGTYYLKVVSYYSSTTEYPLTLSTEALPDANYEPNNSFNSARSINLPFDQQIYSLGSSDEDWFKFTLTQEQAFLMEADDFGWSRAEATLYNATGNVVSDLPYSHSRDITMLSAGTYYLKLVSSGEGAYIVKLSSKSIVNQHEPNNTKETAYSVDLGFSQQELLLDKSDEDWFMFTLDETTQISYTVAMNAGDYIWVYLQKADGSMVNAYSFTGSPILAAGTYYLQLRGGSMASSLYSISLLKK